MKKNIVPLTPAYIKKHPVKIMKGIKKLVAQRDDAKMRSMQLMIEAKRERNLNWERNQQLEWELDFLKGSMEAMNKNKEVFAENYEFRQVPVFAYVREFLSKEKPS